MTYGNGRIAPMKYLSLAPFAALAAIMQAITIYSYDQDAMAVAGQIFFPVLFTLMALYLMLKNPGGSAKLTLVMAIELVISALTFVGSSQKIAALYPSIIVYYVALAALALEVAARIADTPKRAKAPADGDDTPETDSPAAEQEHDSAGEHDPDETALDSDSAVAHATEEDTANTAAGGHDDSDTTKPAAPKTPTRTGMRAGLNRKAPVRRGNRLIATTKKSDKPTTDAD